MSLLASAVDPRLQPPRSRMFWVTVGVLIGGQLFAFWLLCSHQVRKAEARSNEFTVNRMVLAECLQYIPGSTIASCSAQGTTQAQPQSARKPGAGAAVPVSFSYR